MVQEVMMEEERRRFWRQPKFKRKLKDKQDWFKWIMFVRQVTRRTLALWTLRKKEVKKHTQAVLKIHKIKHKRGWVIVQDLLPSISRCVGWRGPAPGLAGDIRLIWGLFLARSHRHYTVWPTCCLRQHLFQ